MAAVSLFLTPAIRAADVENCDLCHQYSGLGRIDESGTKHLFYVNQESYNHSAHGRVRCKGCHVDIEEFPHANAKKVDCATECHLVEPSVERKFSHTKMIEEYNRSVHGRMSGGKEKQHADDLPTCTYCHDNRILDPLHLGRQLEDISQEILDRCLGCHEDETWTRTYFTHLTHRLKQRRSSRDMVELCASCHEDEEKMKRHGLEATGTYRDTFHWQSIKYGDPNAPNCIDCHAPVGYFSHTIMPKEDPRSAVYKDTLVRTCSNPYGIQECHIDATPAFAQGKIHPSGAKAAIFDLKLATLEKQEQIKAGELKPFASLFEEKAQEELTALDYYQTLALRLIKYFYMLLIGGLISFMIVHQFLDVLATRREMKKRGAHP
jgi:hypothetical protein